MNKIKTIFQKVISTCSTKKPKDIFVEETEEFIKEMQSKIKELYELLRIEEV